MLEDGREIVGRLVMWDGGLEEKKARRCVEGKVGILEDNYWVGRCSQNLER